MFVELHPDNNSPAIVNISSPELFMHNGRCFIAFFLSMTDY
jgi:hypothetical protein